MVTPKGSMSTEGEILPVSVLHYRCSICPHLVTRTCQSCNQVPDTHVARVWQELDYSIDICASPRVDISSTCKVGQKFGVSLPLLTCFPSAWPSRLLNRRGRKSRKDLWITLYIWLYRCGICLISYHTRCICLAGTWLQDRHLPRHQGWTYRAPVK